MNTEINIVFNIDDFLETVSEYYPNTNVSTMLKLKNSIIYYLKTYNIQRLRDMFESKIPLINYILNWEFIRKTALSKSFILSKEKEYGKEIDNDFYKWLCKDITYSNYISLLRTTNDLESSIKKIDEYFDLRSFENKLKTQINRTKKLKRLLI